MEDLEEILQKSQIDFSEAQNRQAEEDLNEMQGITNRLTSKASMTTRRLRLLANKLDDAWTDGKLAHAAGTSFGIMGGLLTLGGGVATFLTAGAATPLLVLGMAVGGAGVVTNVAAGRIEASINSQEIKKAEKDLKETIEYVNIVNGTIQKWQDGKEVGRLLCIFYRALHTLKKTDPVMKILQKVISHSLTVSSELLTNLKDYGLGMVCASKLAGQAAVGAADDVVGAAVKAGAQGADDVVGAGVKVGANASKIAGGVIIGVSALFLVWDTIDLCFTIKDLIEEKGSEVGKELREKARQLEKECSFD